jgi:hypothetical protein
LAIPKARSGRERLQLGDLPLFVCQSKLLLDAQDASQQLVEPAVQFRDFTSYFHHTFSWLSMSDNRLIHI